MEASIRLLRDIIDIALAGSQRLAGDETWTGPRADQIEEDLRRLRSILDTAHDLAVRAAMSGGETSVVESHDRSTPDFARRPWEF